MQEQKISPRYALITPAFNEAGFIERTIKSVLSQTATPRQWIIVDDGSTDRTRDIVESYAREVEWLTCYRREKNAKEAYFASNVNAIKEGVRQLGDITYDYLAVLDADIELPEDYYETLIGRFIEDRHLGIASGVYENLIKGKRRKVLNDRRSTPKAIQVFKRKCYEDIGGYLPLVYGGEDTCACIMARMKGWKTWSFPDIKVIHLRPTGMGNMSSILGARFVQGRAEYDLGTHPLFMIGKSLKRSFKESPYLIGGLTRLAGFIWQTWLRKPRLVSAELIHFVRREQWRRALHWNRIPTDNRYIASEANRQT